MSYPKQVIDIHTHLFNAHALPIEAILEQGSFNGVKLPAWLAKLLAGLINALTGTEGETAEPEEMRLAGAPSPLVAALEALQRGEGPVETRLEDVAAAVTRLAAVVLARRRLSALLAVQSGALRAPEAAKISRALKADQLTVALEAIQKRYTKEVPGAEVALVGEHLAALSAREATRVGVAIRSPKDATTDLMTAATIQLSGPLKWLVGKLFAAWQAVRTGADDVAFLFFLMLDEGRMLERLQASYKGVTNAKLNHLMMDMAPAYHQEPHDRFGRQVQRMQGLMSVSGGMLTGFVAFDPRRAGSLQLVREALETRGFTGVKVYPGLGYVPTLDSAKGGAIWAEFLDVVCNRGAGNGLGKTVPVLAHCTPAGWELQFGTDGLNSDPIHWEEILKTYPELRLCLGHAGGSGVYDREDGKKYLGWADPWNQPATGNYAQKIVALCSTFKDVYCDFSYHELLVVDRPERDGAADKNQMVENLAAALLRAGKYRFGEKMMYGSDFHMPTMVSRTRTYFEEWCALLDRVAARLAAGAGTGAGAAISPDALKQKFFHDNARRFLS